MLHFSAQSSGLLCEENDGQSGPTVKYVGYCQFHWNKKVLILSFNVSLITYHILTSSIWSLEENLRPRTQYTSVMTKRWQGQYTKASVWDFPKMTKWVIYYNGLFWCNLFKTSGVIEPAINWTIKVSNWSADNFKKTHHLNALFTWAHDSDM